MAVLIDAALLGLLAAVAPVALFTPMRRIAYLEAQGPG